MAHHLDVAREAVMHFDPHSLHTLSSDRQAALLAEVVRSRQAREARAARRDTQPGPWARMVARVAAIRVPRPQAGAVVVEPAVVPAEQPAV